MSECRIFINKVASGLRAIHRNPPDYFIVGNNLNIERNKICGIPIMYTDIFTEKILLVWFEYQEPFYHSNKFYRAFDSYKEDM